MAVVTSRNSISSRRCFIHLVSNPTRFAGLESVQLFFSDHSGPVSIATKARAASRLTGEPCAASDMMCALEPPKTTARLAGPSGIKPVSHVGDDLIGLLLVRTRGCRRTALHGDVFTGMADHHRDLARDEEILVLRLRVGQRRSRNRGRGRTCRSTFGGRRSPREN